MSERCANCERDTRYSQASGMDWRVKLDAEDIYSKDFSAADYYIYPPFKAPKYFCDLYCLKDWIKKYREKEDD